MYMMNDAFILSLIHTILIFCTVLGQGAFKEMEKNILGFGPISSSC